MILSSLEGKSSAVKTKKFLASSLELGGVVSVPANVVSSTVVRSVRDVSPTVFSDGSVADELRVALANLVSDEVISSSFVTGGEVDILLLSLAIVLFVVYESKSITNFLLVIG